MPTDLYPNSANSGGWKATVYPAPGTLTDWTAGTALSTAERDTLSVLAGTVDVANVYTEPNWEKGGVDLYFRKPAGTPTQIDVTVDMVDGGSEGTALQVWNANTSAWEQKAIHTGGAPGSYQLTFSITSNVANYVDGSDDIHVLVHSTSDDSVSCEVARALCSVTAGEISLAGSISGVSAVSGNLSGSWALAGTIAGAASVSGLLGIPRALAGSIAGQATVTGALTVSADPIPIAGSIAGQSAVAGTLSVTRGLSGSIAAQAGADGVLTVTGPVANAGAVIMGAEF